MEQSFPDRRPADAELAHQLALGGKVVVGRVFADERAGRLRPARSDQ